METLKYYQIDLKDLSQATTYKFDYLLDDYFFDCIKGTEVKKGKVNAALSVVRFLTTFELDFQINGMITVTCDRCLEEFEIPVETANRLIVSFGQAYAEISDERIIVSEEEGFINIAWLMYEFIALAIPMKHVHKPGDCNEVMASKLREHCVDELMEADGISEAGNRKHAADPRWDILRNLKKEN